MQAVCENRSLIPYGNSVTVLRADTNESKGHRKNEKIDTTDIKVRRSRISVSVIVNYILSITMVFDADKDANKVKQFVVFLILSIIGLGINQLIMWGGTSWLDQYMERSYMLVKIVATAVVMVYNFITRKIFIEKKPEK